MALSEQEALERFNEHRKESAAYASDFHRAALRAYGYYSGSGQWDSEDVAALKTQRRPALTLNNIQPIVDVVTGSEITARFESKYQPRTAEDEPHVDMMNELYRYIRDKTNAEQVESKAFADAVITGLGCTEILQDYETDRDGIQRILRVPPRELQWDPASKETNLLDSFYVIRKKQVSKRKFRVLWPEHAALVDTLPSSPQDLSTIESGPRADPWGGKADGPSSMVKKDSVLVSEHQFFEVENLWISSDSTTGADVEFRTAEEAKNFQRSIIAIAQSQPELQIQIPPVVKIPSRRYYRSFVAGNGTALLEFGELPVQGGFTYQFITCFDDIRDDGTIRYGLVRNAEAPQQAYNKYVSQLVHIISVNPKGAMAHETGTFANLSKAKQNWAMPDGDVEINPGMMERFKQLDGAKMPSGMENLTGLFKDSLTDVTGININYLGGQAEDLRRTSTSLVQLIQRQGMVVLSNPFDALRLYRKTTAELLQSYIAKYWSEGRIFRVTGSQYAAYAKDWTRNKYDVIVDEAPSSVNQQMEAWNAMTQTNGIMELLISLGIMTPDIVADIAPGLPTEVRDRMKGNAEKMLAQAAQPPGGAPPQGPPPGEAPQF